MPIDVFSSIIKDRDEGPGKGRLHITRKSRFIVMAVLSVVALAMTGCGPKTDAAQQGNKPEVAVVTVREEPVTLTTELPARTSPYLVAEVRPQVSGIIQKRLFTEGSDVKAGQVLYQIDPAPYQAVYDNAKAALARAEAHLPAVRVRLERYKELVDIKAVSRQDYDDAEAAMKQALADVEVGRAAVETARINLAYTKVTSPVSGRVGKSNVTVGALATAHQGPPFTTVQQLDPIYVDATQSSARLLQLNQYMAAGQITNGGAGQARVKLILENGKTYANEGTLKFSDVTVEPTTGSYLLRMVFPNPKHTLLPGMYVQTIVQEGVVQRGIMVPQQGVSRDTKGNPICLVVNGENKVEQRTIVTPRAMGDKWFVTSGLKAGERMVVEGLQKVRPGAQVKMVPFEPERKDAQVPDKTGQAPPNKG